MVGPDAHGGAPRRRNSFCLLTILALALVQSAPLLAADTYTISGRIKCGLFGFGIPGIKLYGLPGDPKTDSDGDYHATVPAGWSGAAYPQESGLHFDPPFRVYTNVNSNITSNYKTALPETVISGYVRTPGGEGIDGVTMSGLHGTPVTNYHGFYLSYEGSSYSGTVTPQMAGYTFSPPTRTSSSKSSDVDDADFTGSQQTAPQEITHVDDSNTTGTQDGTERYPFTTIAQGIAAVVDGGVVKVAQGTYTGNLTIAGKRVTIEGGYVGATSYAAAAGDFNDANRNADPAANNTVIDGGGTATEVVCGDATAEGSVVAGIRFRNGGATFKGVVRQRVIAGQAP